MSDNSDKYKYLAKNIGLLMLSSFATKLLSFFLVPLYTNILTTTEYGISDLFRATIGILIPILTVNIQESVLRFSLDGKYDKQSVLSVGIRHLLIGLFIVIVLLGINNIFGFYNLFRTYAMYFFLMFFSQVLSGMMLAYIRGINRIADLSFSSVINSLVIIICNILFLVVFRWGLIGYFWANIIGPFVQCGYIMVRAKVFEDVRFGNIDLDVSREMITYSRPLIANSIGWWINNAADKYVIIYFWGMAENGIYSVAGKIPLILNIFQSVFAQAWTLSAVKNYDPDDKDGFFAKTYATYNCMMTVGCSALIVANKMLARILYAKDFYVAWQYVPWLTIAIVFGSLSGYIGGFFSAVKKSKIFGQSTLIGAVCNVVLNFTLTPGIGAMGAAIATAVSYGIVWAFRLVHSRKYIKLRIRLVRDCITYVLLVTQTVVLLVMDGRIMYAIETGMFVGIVILYIKDIRLVTDKVKTAVGKRIHR